MALIRHRIGIQRNLTEIGRYASWHQRAAMSLSANHHKYHLPLRQFDKGTDMLLDMEGTYPLSDAGSDFGASLDFNTYASTYLDRVCGPDRFGVLSLRAHPKGMELRLQVEQYFGQGHVPFHLSNIAAVVWIQQLGVVFSRWIDGDTKKSSFVDMIELSIRCNKPVRDTEELVFTGTVERSRSFRGGRLYVTRFSVQDDSFVGKATFYYAGKNSLAQLSTSA
jgi:hypothetical protein